MRLSACADSYTCGQLRQRAAAIDARQKIRGEHVLRPESLQEVVGFIARRHGQSRLLDVASGFAQQRDASAAEATQENGFEARLQRARHPRKQRELILLGIARVAAEQLVPAVAAQHAFDSVGAREPGAAVGRDRRRIAERLVVGGGNKRDGGDHVGGRHVVFVMVGR